MIKKGVPQPFHEYFSLSKISMMNIGINDFQQSLGLAVNETLTKNWNFVSWKPSETSSKLLWIRDNLQ
jgi:hypothetical protein